MANRERNKRSARQARARERAAQQAARAGSAAATSASKGTESSKGRSKEVVAKSAKTGPLARLRGYLGDVRTEMHRVVWPSRTELTNYSVAVIIALVVFGVAVWAVDTGFVALLVAFTGLRG